MFLGFTAISSVLTFKVTVDALLSTMTDICQILAIEVRGAAQLANTNASRRCNDESVSRSDKTIYHVMYLQAVNYAAQ
jgi:hypothetical protein